MEGMAGEERDRPWGKQSGGAEDGLRNGYLDGMKLGGSGAEREEQVGSETLRKARGQ